MNAAVLMRQLADAGIRLSVTGDRLHVEAKPGTVTPELRCLLVNRKSDLLAELTGTRGQLLQLAEALGVAALVHELSAAAMDGFDALPNETLLACLRTLREDADRRVGRIPAGDTAAVLCRSCGPVWLSPAVAAVVPRLNGTPYVLGCPWCHVRTDEVPIPRPPVQCGTCASFIPDSLNPQDSWGSCRQGIEQPGQWPMTAQHCARWRPRDPDEEHSV